MHPNVLRTARVHAITPIGALLAVAVGCDAGVPAGAVAPQAGRNPSQSASQQVTTPAAGAHVTRQWNALTHWLVEKNKPGQQGALRAFAYLGVAQDAAARAVGTPVGTPGGSADARRAVRVAIAAASAEVLAHLFPNDAAAIGEQLRRSIAGEATGSAPAGGQLAADRDGAPPSAVEAARVAGRDAGARVVERAAGDGFDAVWTGTVPTGPGMWTSARPPLLPRFGEARTFFLTSGSQVRPAPPPSYGSPEFQAALDEVRAFSEQRSPEHQRLAEQWAGTTGSLVAGYWNHVADSLIARYRLTEGDAAHALALMNAAAWDANVACHDAKYTYWLLRPSMADSRITTAVGLPNHPSYPSNHSCLSGAAAYVLAALFPAEAAGLRARADEATLSRIVGGLHYRFDGEAGLAIARAVSAIALQAGGTGSVRAAH